MPAGGERSKRRDRRSRRADVDARGVQLAMIVHFARRMAPAVLVVVVYTMVAAALVRFDMQRVGEKAPDYGVALYAMYTQLFFEPTESLPRAPLARFLFWITPLAGFVLIAEGLYKVGATLLDERARREVWVRIMSERLSGHVVVCGLGHVGYRVVEELRLGGEAVVAIERTEDDSFLETVRAMGIPVHIGDARRDEVLERTGIARAKAVVCATGDDLANLEVALDAKRMNPDIRVVLRMFDQRLAAKVGGALELDQTFSTSAVAAPLVALQATQRGIRAAYRTGDGAARVVAEITVGEAFDPTEVSELEDKIEGRIVGLRHATEEAFKGPRSSTRVLAGDVVVIDAQPSDLAWIRKKLRAV